MSKSEDIAPARQSGPLSSTEVLDRIAAIAGARNDAALARAMDVSRQTLASWRQRGTVPYEAAVRFAVKHDAPLDYLLLGRGSPWSVSGGVVDQLLIAIGDALTSKWLTSGGMEALKPGSRSFIHYCAVIYNRVIALTPSPTGDPYKHIESEVGQLHRLLEIEAQLRRKPKKPLK